MIPHSIMLGFAAFVFYLLAVLILLRVCPERTALRVVVLAAVFFAPLSAAALTLSGLEANFWSFTVSYSFFTLCFLMAFGAIYKSISLRMMMDLLKRPGHANDMDVIVKNYLTEDSFQDRLAVVQQNFLVDRTEGWYVLTVKGRAFAGRIRCVQRLFNITKSG